MKNGKRGDSPQFTKRLIITFSLFAVGTVVYCVFAIARINRLHHDVSDYHGPALFELVDIQSQTRQAVQESVSYVVSGNVSGKQEFERLTRDLPLAEGRFRKTAKLNEPNERAEREMFDSIVDASQRMAVIAKEMFAEFEAHGKVAGVTFERYDKTVDELADKTNTLIQTEEMELDHARVASASVLRQTTWQLGFLAVVTCALSAVSTVSLLRSFKHYVADKLRSRFVQEVLSAQESERRRIAQELHDETGSALTSVMIGLRNLGQDIADQDLLARIGRLQIQIERTLDEVRRLAHGLHPLALEQLGFGVAVEQYVRDYASLHDLDVRVRINKLPESIPLAVSTTLYRILQEALMNVVKHADAAHVSVVVDHRADELVVVVEDDGRGIQPADRKDGDHVTNFGLHGIRERVSALGGKLVIEPTPGGGTTLLVEVPWSDANHG